MMIRTVLYLLILKSVSGSDPTPAKRKGVIMKKARLACGPYPDGLKTLRECCKVPQLFDRDAGHACEDLCDSDEKDSKNPDCVIECLFTNNKMMRRKEMNRTAIAIHYMKFKTADPDWEPVIELGLNKCPLAYNATGFQETFNNFEKCMRRTFRKNCVEFVESVQCDPVDDFMYKCLKMEPNCTVWPKWIVRLPEMCCNVHFDMFTLELKNEAIHLCETSDPSNLGKMHCKANFLLQQTKIKVDGKWDFKLATTLLLESSKHEEKWKVPIEKTIEQCEKNVKDDEASNQTENYINFWFYECVKATLADLCVDYHTDKKSCRRIKKYKDACPLSAPPRKELMVNGKMI